MLAKLVLTLTALIGVWAGHVYGAVAAGELPWLYTDGKWIKDPAGNNIVLFGANVPIAVENESVTFRERIEKLQKFCEGEARIVRLFVIPAMFFSNPDQFLEEHLDPAVAICREHRLYCIIEPHFTADLSSELKEDLLWFWKTVAPRYGNQSHVWFDIINEPIEPMNWRTWKEWMQPIVGQIRARAPRNMLLIGGPLWCTDLTGAVSDPISSETAGPGDFNIVYAAHIYPYHPRNPGPVRSRSGQENLPQPDPRIWQEHFGEAAEIMPVLVSEFGWQPHPDEVDGSTDGWGKPFRRFLDSKSNVGWLAWVFHHQMTPIMLTPSGDLTGGELMGEFVIEWIKSKGRTTPRPAGETVQGRQVLPPSKLRIAE